MEILTAESWHAVH